jgi:hypothetical protein
MGNTAPASVGIDRRSRPWLEVLQVLVATRLAILAKPCPCPAGSAGTRM